MTGNENINLNADFLDINDNNFYENLNDKNNNRTT